MKFLKDIRSIFNPIYFDRMIARGNPRQHIVVILLLPFLLAGFGLLCKELIHLGTPVSLDNMKEGLIWDVYENYINPNAYSGRSFSRRLFMLMVGTFGVFLLNGLLVSAIVSWVERRSERWCRGEMFYDHRRWFQCSDALQNHIVIIGGNGMVPNLIREILSKNTTSYALVMTNRDVPALRKKLSSTIGELEERVVIYSGERTLIDDLRRLQLPSAEKIYVIGEELDIDQKGFHHDVKNMQCVSLMSEILAEEKKENTKVEKKPCKVMFEYQSSFSVFQITDVDNKISDVLKFRPFNYYETWAQKVLACDKIDLQKDHPEYLPLEGEKPIDENSTDTVHLIVVGMSRMGMAMGITAAQLAHYPNFIKSKGNLRTRITFIDSQAKKEMQYFQGHYKELFAISRWRYVRATDDNIYYNEKGHLSYDYSPSSWHDPLNDKKSHSPYKDIDKYSLGKNIVDVDWEFIQGNLEMPTVQCYIREAAKHSNVRLTIAICFPQDNVSFAASLYLPDEVYEKENNVVQVLAYQPHGDAMRKSFKGGIGQSRFNLFNKLKAFGMIDSCYEEQYQEDIEAAAEKLWTQYDEKYKIQIGFRNTLLQYLLQEEPIKAGKSFAARTWSNKYAALHMYTKIRNTSLREVLKKPNEEVKDNGLIATLAELEHVRWNMEQLLMGFAPLRSEEQNKMRELLENACHIKEPSSRLKSKAQKAKEEKSSLAEEDKKIICEWLEAWKEFDTQKEIYKARMSHLDICSVEVLEKIDSEAINYDIDMTKILPAIYNSIKNNQ